MIDHHTDEWFKGHLLKIAITLKKSKKGERSHSKGLI